MVQVLEKDNLVNKARNLGVRASQHTAKVINQVQTENKVNIFLPILLNLQMQTSKQFDWSRSDLFKSLCLVFIVVFFQLNREKEEVNLELQKFNSSIV